MATPDSNVYSNDKLTEELWAFKAMEHADVYYNLISSVDPSKLNLTKHDEEIYKEFKKDFPEFKVDVINVDDLKTEKAKMKWRPFCNHFDGMVKDFNFGTLVRLDANKEYSEENSTFVTRIQFLAIEIARNRLGLNKNIYEAAKLKRQNKIDNENKCS